MKNFKINGKIMNKWVILSLIICFCFCPVLIQAAGLVPCGGETEPACNLCHLLVLVQNVLHFAIEMAFLVVIILIVYGGLRWIFSLGKEENIKAGQRIITNAIIGIVIILAAWIIVNTVFWFIAIMGGEDYTGTWYNIECEELEDSTPTSRTESGSTAPTSPTESGSTAPSSPSLPTLNEQIEIKKNEIEQKYSDIASYGQWASSDGYCRVADCEELMIMAECTVFTNTQVKDGFCIPTNSTTRIIKSEKLGKGWSCTFRDDITKNPTGKAYAFCIPSYIH
ncbi:MAG: pilin [Candidatus Pacebacteria bacterium]|nr:pilin [Candidatus Paceibacterota bacterium]